jgi:acyl-CoA thioesterase-1
MPAAGAGGDRAMYAGLRGFAPQSGGYNRDGRITGGSRSGRGSAEIIRGSKQAEQTTGSKLMQTCLHSTLFARTKVCHQWACCWKAICFGALIVFITAVAASGVRAQEAAKPGWTYSEEQLRPFWQGEVMEGESVLFIKDEKTGEARASVLFPIQKLLSVRDSAGEVQYQEGRDYAWKAGSREIVIPPGSRIITSTPEALRRPAKSQAYQLTHRDGNGEIYFGGKLEYHGLQTIINYSHAPNLWTSPVPKFDPKALPLSVRKLQSREPLKIVVLGDSISTGCNASGWADGKPFQPAYPELVSRLLQEKYKGQVEVANLSVGGMDSAWGLTMVDKVVEAEPDLVLLAFGMNDSSGRPAGDFQDKIAATIKRIREKRPGAEFILVATMVGNPNWIALKQELFPEYRDALAKLCGSGVALADVTSIWSEFLRLKHDWDQTGNGVNHPNDFGHRVYAQVISTLLISNGEPASDE